MSHRGKQPLRLQKEIIKSLIAHILSCRSLFFISVELSLQGPEEPSHRTQTHSDGATEREQKVKCAPVHDFTVTPTPVHNSAKEISLSGFYWAAPPPRLQWPSDQPSSASQFMSFKAARPHVKEMMDGRTVQDRYWKKREKDPRLCSWLFNFK